MAQAADSVDSCPICLDEIAELQMLPCGMIIHQKCYEKFLKLFSGLPFSEFQCAGCSLIHHKTNYQQQLQSQVETKQTLVQKNKTQEGVLQTMNTLVDQLRNRVQAMPELVKLSVDMASWQHKQIMVEKIRKLQLLKEKLRQEETCGYNLAANLARDIPRRLEVLNLNLLLRRRIVHELTYQCRSAVMKKYNQNTTINTPI